MELTAKEILEKHSKGNLLTDEYILAAMKEACILAYRAGAINMNERSHYPSNMITAPNQEEFINSLFPESKSPGIELNYGIVDEFTQESRPGIVVSNGITSTEK
jgi:hypothetical protein